MIGFDVDPKKPEALNRGESYIKHIGPDRVAKAFASGRICATTAFEGLADCDAILICVPTPLGRHREPDITYIQKTAEAIAANSRPGQLVILESTTYPGTTREEIVPRLEATGLKCGTDVFVAFSPEREDPGNPTYHTRNIPKVVGGIDPASGDVAEALYAGGLEKVVRVSTAEVAESGKLLENIFRSVNIALVNELKIVFDRMGIDVWEVIEAAKSKPFGYMPFYPGPGIGGHCIPLDPFYLSWKAAEHGTWARFIELAGEINASMPHYVVDKTVKALGEMGKSIKGAKVLLLGLSYKADIDDDRESPSYELIDLFDELGADWAYCDPFIPKARIGRKNKRQMSSVPCTREEFGKYDVLVVATAHKAFKDATLYGNAPLVVDARNIVQPAPAFRLVKA